MCELFSGFKVHNIYDNTELNTCDNSFVVYLFSSSTLSSKKTKGPFYTACSNYTVYQFLRRVSVPWSVVHGSHPTHYESQSTLPEPQKLCPNQPLNPTQPANCRLYALYWHSCEDWDKRRFPRRWSWCWEQCSMFLFSLSPPTNRSGKM